MRNGMVFATLTDGRPGRLSQNIYSWVRNAGLYHFDEIIIFDNSGSDPQNSTEVNFVLEELIPRTPIQLDNLKVVKMGEETLPLGKAHDFVFKYLLNNTNYRFTFFIEDDHFLMDRVPVDKLYNLLNLHSDIVQIVINRNPVYPREFECGSVLKDWRNLHGNLVELQNKEIGIKYTTRDLHFVFGVSFINLEYMDTEMPSGDDLWEWNFGKNIKQKYPSAKFAWYGWIEDPPLACTWLTEDYFYKSFHTTNWSLLSDSN